MNDNFCRIIKELAVLKENNGYRRVLNIISWNYYEPKLDLHEWTPDGKCTKRGFALTDEEARILLDALTQYFKDKEKTAEKEDPATEDMVEVADSDELPF